MSYEQRVFMTFFLIMIVVMMFTMMNPPDPDQRTRQVPDPSSPSDEIVADPLEREHPFDLDPAAPDQRVSALPEWGWLSADATLSVTHEVVVESDLYRVRFSKTGAAPTSWELPTYRELFADQRYLRMRADFGSQLDRLKAMVEFNHLNRAEAMDEPPSINALNPLFEPGAAGLLFRWGSIHPDSHIRFESNVDRLEVVDEPRDLTFRTTQDGVTLEKIYRFYPDSYLVDLRIRIVNNTGEPLTFGDRGFYDITWQGGFGFPSLRGDARNTLLLLRGGDLSIQQSDILARDLHRKGARLSGYPFPMETLPGQPVGWVGVGQKYFLAAMIPHSPSRLAIQGIASPGGSYDEWYKPIAGIRMEIDSLPAGATHSDRFTLYVGPMDEDQLVKAQSGLEDARQMFLKRFTGPIAQIMLYLLQWLYTITPNYGVCIIILTLIIKTLMFPLYHKQLMSMKKMQALTPQIKALQEQYKKDPQKLQKEQMDLFRRHKVNPLSGCLPILPTIPIFIALYATFSTMVELRGAEFIFWINDLSEPDRAFFIPFGSYIFSVNILPLAYAIMMYISMSISMRSSTMEGPQATVMKMMPFIFVVFFWTIASGVILYFVISIMIDLIQRLVLDKLSKDDPLAVESPTKSDPNKERSKERPARTTPARQRRGKKKAKSAKL